MWNDKVKEECGIFGLFNNNNLNTSEIVYLGISMLQHRGQESAGIAVTDKNGRINCHKEMGLVSRVFDKFNFNSLEGNIGIGHVRYSSAKDRSEENVQPIALKYKNGNMALAHNGSIVNIDKLRENLENSGFIFQATMDVEIIGALLSKKSIDNAIENALKEVLQEVKGAYALVISTGDKLIALRDPLGIRPLCIGKIKDSYVVSSESVAFNAVGAEFIRDINPGEIVIIDKEGLKSVSVKQNETSALCIFEHIYIARPDSIMDGSSIYTARMEAGKILARECKIDADMVIGVPDSGIPAALGYAQESGIPYGEGFIKNRYVGRTFIQPSQFMREQAVHMKLSALKEQVEGKKIIMIDDSIVRGTTSKKIVNLLKKAGAKEVHLMIASPMVKHCCHYGINTPNKNGLIANTHTIEEMEKEIGADSIYFISLEGIKKSPKNPKLDFCAACFDGCYPVKIQEEN